MTWRSTDVFRPLKLKSRRPGRCGAFRSACVSRVFGNGIARSFPCVASRSIDRPARIPQPEQLGHLVVGLARRIVACTAQGVGTRRRGRRGKGWCGRPTRRGRPPAAASRRSRAPATRCGRPGGGRARAARRAPRPAISRTRRRPAATRRGRAPASRQSRRTQATPLRPARARRRRRCRGCAVVPTAPARRRPTRGGSSTCDATTLDRIRHGRAGSPVSSTTAAAVSSHDVSMPRMIMAAGSGQSAAGRSGRHGGRIVTAFAAALAAR